MCFSNLLFAVKSKDKNMKFSNIKLPSNKKFGYFFSGIFLVISIYLFYLNIQISSYVFLALSILFLTIAFFNADYLHPLNKLWMQFGLLLGMVISPIILGIIFFGIFTPYGLIMRITGRDELRLKSKNDKSYWILKSKTLPQTDFKQQF